MWFTLTTPPFSVEAKPVGTIEAEELTVVLAGCNLPYRTRVVSFSSFKTILSPPSPYVWSHFIFWDVFLLIPSDQLTVWNKISSEPVFMLEHITDDVMLDTFDYWWYNLDCLIIPVSSLALFTHHIKSQLPLCWYQRFLQPLFSTSKEPKWTAQSLFALAERSILNKFWTSYPISFPVIWYILYLSNFLLRKDGSHWTLMPTDTLTYERVLTVHNRNASFKGILRSFLTELRHWWWLNDLEIINQD